MDRIYGLEQAIKSVGSALEGTVEMDLMVLRQYGWEFSSVRYDYSQERMVVDATAPDGRRYPPHPLPSPTTSIDDALRLMPPGAVMHKVIIYAGPEGVAASFNLFPDPSLDPEDPERALGHRSCSDLNDMGYGRTTALAVCQAVLLARRNYLVSQQQPPLPPPDKTKEGGDDVREAEE